jgi:hypothetical protein
METGADCSHYDAPPELPGSCYDSSTHEVSCGVMASECAGSSYEAGYVSGRNGCCHCKTNCDHSMETSTDCSYYDAPTESAGCYNLNGMHSVKCSFNADEAVTEEECTAGDGTFLRETDSCAERLMSGGCYDMTTHTVTCAWFGETTKETCTGVWMPEYSAVSHPNSAGSTCMDRIDAVWFSGCYSGPPDLGADSMTCLNKGEVTEATCTGTWVAESTFCGAPDPNAPDFTCQLGWGCYNRDVHGCECPIDTFLDGVRLSQATCNNDAGLSDNSPPPSWTEGCGCTC